MLAKQQEKARIFFFLYLTFNTVIAALRLWEIFNQSSHILLAILVPLNVINFIIELGFICFFYSTTLEFTRILKQEQCLQSTLYRVVFFSICLVLVVGNWDIYIDWSFLLINNILLDSKYCEPYTSIIHVLNFF